MDEVHVLIVEDEVLAAMTLASELIGLGYPDPVLAHSGEEALKRVADKSPDIILMDIHLGSAPDGIETATLINKNHPLIPIIFLTAYSDNDNIMRAQRVNPYGYLIKPYRIQEVHSSIQMTLHKNRLFCRLSAGIEEIDSVFNASGNALMIIKNGMVQSINELAQMITGLENPTDEKPLKARNLNWVENESPFDLELFIFTVEASEHQKRLPNGLAVLDSQGKRHPIQGTAFSFYTPDNEQVVCIMFHPQGKPVSLDTSLKNESLKEIVQQRVMFSHLKRNLEENETRNAHPQARDPEHLENLKKELKALFKTCIEKKNTHQMVQDYSRRLYQGNVPPTDVMDMYISLLPELLYEYPDTNSDQILSDLRFASMEIFVTLSELLRQKGESKEQSTLDQPGVLLKLDATAEEMNAFKLNSREQMQQLMDIILALETGTDPETVNTAFRIAHTIKGNSGIIKHQRLTMVMHEMETILDQIRTQKLTVCKELIDVILAAMDVVGTLLNEMERGAQSSVRVTEILDRLSRFSKHSAPEPAVTASPVRIAEEELNPAQLEMVRLAKARGMHAYTLRIRVTQQADMPNLTLSIALTELAKFGEILSQQPTHDELMGAGTYTELSGVFVSRETQAHIQAIGENLMDVEFFSCAPLSDAAVTQKSKTTDDSKEVRSESAKSNSVRVTSDKLDSLINLVGELVITQSRLLQISQTLSHPDLENSVEELERLSTNLRDIVLNVRMIPLGITFNKFRRVIRDLSTELKKDVQMTMEGAETELDKNIVEKLDDCLMHLIRNCMDHGIEPPEERVKAGKPAQGTIRMTAEHQGANVVICIEDDGGGLDPEKIRKKGIERGLIDPNTVLTDNEIYKLIFLPGFSTADKVTNISGRGVGMDFIKRKIEELRGSVHITSQKGQFTRITLSLPLTLAIIEGLLVSTGESSFIIPMANVDECLEHKTADQQGENRRLITVRDELIPYIRLREFFQVPADGQLTIEETVIVKLENFKLGIVVDKIIGQHQTVIKALGKVYQNADCLAGATIMGDGVVALILDVGRMIQCAISNEQQLVAV